MKNKGFTLIELLAVIVILAIISLIAVPMILGVVEEAKKGAAESSALGYIDAVEKYMVMTEFENSSILADGLYYVINNSYYKLINLNNDIFLNNIIKVKGAYPLDGYIEILNGKINDVLLVFNDYEVTCNKNIECQVGEKINSEIEKIILSTEIEDFANLEENQTFKIKVDTIPKKILNRNFEYISSDENIAVVDENGLVKILKKGNVEITVRANNGKYSKLYIYMMDPTAPIISIDKGYPLLKRTGITYNNKINIKYDNSRNDISNYYSIDNGQTWMEYDGPFESYSNNIIAKSVVNSTKKEVVTSDVLINEKTDVLPVEAYDNDENTLINFSGYGPIEYFIDVSSEQYMYNSSIILSLSMGHYTTYGIKFYNQDNNEIDSSLQSGNVDNSKLEYVIPSGTTKVGIFYSSSHPGDWGHLKEIYLKDIPIISENRNLPFISKSGIKRGNIELSIEYFPTAVKKLYKINDGEWQEYQDKPLQLEINNNFKFEAKSIDKNGKDSYILNYDSKLVLPVDAYDSDESTFVNFSDIGPIEYFIDVSPDMYNSSIMLLLSMGHFTTYGVKFYDQNNNEFDSSLQSGNVVNSRLEYVIPSGTTRIGIFYSSSHPGDWGYLYEISLKS